MSQTETDVKIRPNLTLKEPPLFRVVYLNDNQTTVEFVVTSLIEHFNYTVDTAANITKDIHEQGSAVVALLPYELAEQKGVEVTAQARALSYPLQIKVEAATES